MPRKFAIGIVVDKWSFSIPICVQREPVLAFSAGFPLTFGRRDCALGRHFGLGLFAIEWREANPPTPQQG